MKTKTTFRPYSPTDKPACLGLFDSNCPEFFAPNERLDYASFLDTNPHSYELCLAEGQVVGAFGQVGHGLQQKSLNWILLNPRSHGMGIGSAIMDRISTSARTSGVSLVTIAASHKSAPFFAKFGAVEVAVIDNGWGPDMHRIDMELRL
ncbi:MAG: GNAT family N-acetyltransferase [Halopseudomonas sp.]